MSTAQHPTDWSAWSREAVASMMACNAQWQRDFGLEGSPPYRWDLASATLTFDGALGPVLATICLVGTSSESEGSFLWSWANAAVPEQHGQALEAVHEFGRANQLALLTTPRIQGGRPEATECLCIAARLQRAMGTFIDQRGDVTLYFTVLHLRAVPAKESLPH